MQHQSLLYIGAYQCGPPLNLHIEWMSDGRAVTPIPHPNSSPPPTPPDADEHGLDIDAIFFLKITYKRRPSSQDVDVRGNIHFGTIMIQMAWESWLTVSDGVGGEFGKKSVKSRTK